VPVVVGALAGPAVCTTCEVAGILFELSDGTAFDGAGAIVAGLVGVLCGVESDA